MLQITELDFSRNQFDLAAIDLGEWLKTNKTVQKLSQLAHTAVHSLVRSPNVSLTLQVKRLNLKNNDMHDKATIAIAEALQCNSTLTDLDLTCTFAQRQTRYIAEALEVRAARPAPAHCGRDPPGAPL